MREEKGLVERRFATPLQNKQKGSTREQKKQMYGEK